MTNAFLQLIFWGTLFSSSALAKVTLSGSGSLPRDLGADEFNVSVTISGIDLAEDSLSGDEGGYYNRIEFFINEESENTRVTYENEADNEIPFKISTEETDRETDEENLLTIQYDFVIRANEGRLAALLEENSTSQLNITMSYEDSQNDAIEATFAITRDTAVANEAPGGVTVRGGFRSVVAKWESKTEISFSQSTTGEPRGVNIYAVKKSLGNANIQMKVYDANADEDTQTDTCTVDVSAADGSDCVTCASSSDMYIDNGALKTLNAEDFAYNSASSSATQASIKNLTLDEEYIVFLTYRPDGLQRSACYSATPKENFTLTEFYGEDKAKQGDPRCFIVSAAYGSPMAADVDLYRRFRDEFLLSLPGGEALVEAYYRLSPPLADAIRKNPALAAGMRALLYWPSQVLKAWYTP